MSHLTNVRLTVLEIAQVAHEINRAYCAALGDNSQKSWAEAEAWQRDASIVQTQLHIGQPTAGASASHDAWMKQKLDDGWVHGAVKDGVAKTHPDIVPFEQLPVTSQAKDAIFRAVVLNLAAIE